MAPPKPTEDTYFIPFSFTNGHFEYGLNIDEAGFDAWETHYWDNIYPIGQCFPDCFSDPPDAYPNFSIWSPFIIEWKCKTYPAGGGEGCCLLEDENGIVCTFDKVGDG